MNERLKELAEQNFYYGNWEGDGVFTGQVDLEKFAKLIVQECARVAVYKDDGMISTADVAGYMAAGRAIAARMIKQHFGVTDDNPPPCG